MIRIGMNSRKQRALLVLAAAGAAFSAPAAGERHSVGLKAGLLGFGVEYAYAPADRWAVRGGLNAARLGFDTRESGIDYDVDLVFDSVSLAVDFHPSGGALRVSAGLLRNENRFDVESRSRGQITIGGDVYDASEVGVLLGRVDFDEHAPFVGIGWDASRRRGRRIGWSLDVGLLRQGSPRVALTATGPISELPELQSDLAIEEAELADSVDDFKLAPYGALGIVIRF